MNFLFTPFKALASFAGPSCAAVLLLSSATSHAVEFSFDLAGTAGAGLLPGNENHVVTSGGTGGEVGTGILYETDTNLLKISVAWGSGNLFTDLSGPVTAMHIHGITADPAPTSFAQNAGVLINLHTLGGFNGNATNGGLNDMVTLSDDQETALFEGRLYLNAHTAANGGGEIRGQLVIPEPSSAAMLLAALAGLGLKRRR